MSTVAFDVSVRDPVTICALAKRVPTFDAATEVAAASATSAKITFVSIERLRMLCLCIVH
jgi:hypothetical protein